MELEVNGIKREVIIMPAPQGSYYYEEEIWEPQFPLYIGMCGSITEEEESIGDVIVFPIDGGYNGGYECIEPKKIMNDLSRYVLEKLIACYAFENDCNDLRKIVKRLMDIFEIHKTPILLNVREYVGDVMNGTITKIPTNG